ncbi:transmembrane protease serine 11D-like isoform X3 [Dermochelys coriacea]|uniref:transmembrane protease serine 11D-like isoform X3 n=1 Tax=Dermochelys coriacea TaxID=27794 RepID=UPI001CAA3FAB|nr:transmembrane protease serine 11D-like isoform X3 [Dermochelys coriacea]
MGRASCLGARVHQLATKPKFFKPWKSALIAVAVAMALAITIGLLVYFLDYDQKLFYYNGNFKVTSVQYSNGLARQSSGEFRDHSRRIETVIDKTFQNSILRKKYIRSRVIRLSPDTGGVVAQVVLTFLFSATDNKAALLGKVNSVLQKKLNKYSGPVRIDLASSTISGELSPIGIEWLHKRSYSGAAASVQLCCCKFTRVDLAPG